jgi:hypothetical protein
MDQNGREGQGLLQHGTKATIHVQSDEIVGATASSARVLDLQWCLPRLSAWRAAAYDNSPS